MVEDTVQHHPDAVGVEGITQAGKAVIVSQAAVDLVVIRRVVAVFYRLAHRPQIEGIDPQGLQVGDPVPQLVQPGDRGPAGVIFRAAAEPQGVDMIDHSVVDPVFHRVHSYPRP